MSLHSSLWGETQQWCSVCSSCWSAAHRHLISMEQQWLITQKTPVPKDPQIRYVQFVSWYILGWMLQKNVFDELLVPEKWIFTKVNMVTSSSLVFFYFFIFLPQVTLRYKLNFRDCTDEDTWDCFSGDCGNESTVLHDVEESDEGWCQREGVMTRQVSTNAPFQLRWVQVSTSSDKRHWKIKIIMWNCKCRDQKSKFWDRKCQNFEIKNQKLR